MEAAFTKPNDTIESFPHHHNVLTSLDSLPLRPRSAMSGDSSFVYSTDEEEDPDRDYWADHIPKSETQAMALLGKLSQIITSYNHPSSVMT
jgi:hypothetical protein